MKKMKKALSLLLAVVMVLGMVNVTAFATATETGTVANGAFEANQTDKTLAADFTPNATNTNTTTGGKVSVTKTAAAVTGQDNTFDVTLKVVTKDVRTDEITSPDAAVVLVIDRSISMDFCSQCKYTGNENHNGDDIVHTHDFKDVAKRDEKKDEMVKDGKCDEENRYGGGPCSLTEAQHTANPGSHKTRMDVAKEKVLEFINDYAPDEIVGKGTSRMISLVTFAKDGEMVKLLGDDYWVNAATTQGKAAIVAAINQLGPDRMASGTNIEAGLRLAKNLYYFNADAAQNQKGYGGPVKDITQKYSILLTDGAANKEIDGSASNTATTYKGKTGDSNASHATQAASDLRRQGNVASYGVYFGTDGGGNWMKTGGCFDKYYTATSNDDLGAAFKNIAKIIEVATKAWIVTDPMANGVEYVRIITNQADGVANHDQASNTLTWYLSKDHTRETKNDGTTTYTLTYRVKVDPIAFGSAFEADKVYPLNEYTDLTYAFFKTVTENGSSTTKRVDEAGNDWTGVGVPETIGFNVPGVKFPATELTFDKVAAHDDSKLNGATFTLVHDGENCGCDNATAEWSKTVTSGAGNGTPAGQVKFTNIPSGHTYTLTETTAPSGYVKSTKSYTVEVAYGVATLKDGNETITSITNEPDRGKLDLTVTKNWVGPDEFKRQVTVTVSGGPRNETVTLNEGNNWTQTLNDLPIRAQNGEAYTYTAVENNSDGFDVTYVGNGVTVTDPTVQTYDATIMVTNTPNNLGTVDLKVTKVWDDSPNPSARPNDITLTVTQSIVNGGENTAKNATVKLDSANQTATLTDSLDGTPTVAASFDNNWTATISGLPKYKAGTYEAYTYTVGEATVASGYNAGVAVKGEGNTWTITNKLAQATTEITVNKVWDDYNNAFNSRPNSVTVQLLAGGTAVSGKTLTLTQEESWTGKFTGLDKYEDSNNDGTLDAEIVYTVEEVNVDSHYTAAVEGYTITNTLRDDPSHYLTVTVNKQWVAENATIPGSLTVTLSNGETATLSEANGWTATFVHLPKYNGQGQEIKYTVTEGTVSGFNLTYLDNNEVSVSDGTITLVNTESGFNQGDKVNISVTKVWNDQSDAFGLRPGSITVKLFADGVDTGKTLTLSGNNEWTGAFADLDKYAETVDASGTETVDEADSTDNHDDADIDGSDSNDANIGGGEGEGSDANVTNGEGEDSDANVTNGEGEGSDANVTNGEGEGSDANVTNGEGEGSDANVTNGEGEGSDANLNNGGDSADVIQYSATVVAQQYNGANGGGVTEYHEIKYTVAEVQVEGYTSSINGYTITNTINKDAVDGITGSIKVTKNWKDADNAGETRKPISIRVFADGVEERMVLLPVGKTEYVFTGLPVFNMDGSKIKYTVSEDKVEGYGVPEVTYPGTDNFVTLTKDSEVGVTVTNTVDITYSKLSATKTWVDNENVWNTRPASIKVSLKQNDAVVATKEVTPDASGNWAYTFENSDNEQGWPNFNEDRTVKYEYTVEEGKVDLYETTYAGLDVTNTLNDTVNGKINLPVSKLWVIPMGEDGNPAAGLPDAVFELYANGKKTDTTLTLKPGETEGTFENLNKFENGVEIKYEIKEADNDAYDQTKTEAGVFVNTIKPGAVTLSGTKNWVGGPDREDYSITVNVKRDGAVLIEGLKFGPAEGAEDPKSFTFTISEYEVNGEKVSLPKYAPDGHEYKYELEEVNLPDNYEARITGDATSEDGCTITNTYVEPTTYYYEVVAIYITFDENGNEVSRSGEVQVLPVTESKEKTVSFDVNADVNAKWLTYGSHTYAHDGSIAGNRLSATLTDPAVTEKLVVYYVRTQTNTGGSGGDNPATTGSLRIDKTVVGGGTEARNKTYTFDITGPSYSATLSVTGSGESNSLTNLQPGTYRVTERNAEIAGYDLVTTGDESVTVTVGTVATARITNTYTPEREIPEETPPLVDLPDEPVTDIPEEEPPLVDLPEEEPPVTDIPEEEPPLTDLPDEEPPLVDAPDEQPPLTDLPVEWPPIVVADDPVPVTDIPAEDVPLADVPQTGDISPLWYVTMIAAIVGLVALTFKKREDEEPEA